MTATYAQQTDSSGCNPQQFDNGNDEKRQIGQDDAQQEKVERFSVQPSETSGSNGDGNVQWDSDGMMKMKSPNT